MRRLLYALPFTLLLVACGLPPFQGPSPKPLPNPLDGHQWHLLYCATGIRCIVWKDEHSDGWYYRGPYAPQYAPAWCLFRSPDLYLSEGDFKTVLPAPPPCP